MPGAYPTYAPKYQWPNRWDSASRAEVTTELGRVFEPTVETILSKPAHAT